MVLDDATSEIYYAQLVEAESTLQSDIAGHFFVTPKHGERVETSRPTQVGRAWGNSG